MKKRYFLFPSVERFLVSLLFCLFLFGGTGCALHQPRPTSPMDPDTVPPLLTENREMTHFKGMGVLTLPANIPPGGSLQLAYTGTAEKGLRIAALTPVGIPFFEIAATPDYVHIREIQNGKIRKVDSFTSLSKRILGFPLAFEDLQDLLSDQLPVPDWTKAYTSPDDPGAIYLDNGSRLTAKFFQGSGTPPYKMEYFSGGKSAYTITRVSDQPRVWRIEKPGYQLLLRIRSLTESPPISESLFSLE